MKGNNYRGGWRTVFWALTFLLLAMPVSAKVYKYRDKDGIMHYTDTLSEIPPEKIREVQPEALKDDEKDVKTGLDEKKAGEPKTDNAQAEKPDVKKKIPIVEDLKKEKAELDKIHERLMKKKRALKEEQSTLKTPEQVREHQKKLKLLKRKIDAYQKRYRAFKKKADSYNKALSEKGEK